MKLRAAILLACLAAPALAQTSLSPADQRAAFTAAGYALKGGRWTACPDDTSASYTPGHIDKVADLNGDGRPEALITEGSSYCYGEAEAGYVLVSRQADGKWKRIDGNSGVPTFLATKGVGGWPDIEVGGPGFCFPVLRWNGTAYAFNRNQYEGKRCTPRD